MKKITITILLVVFLIMFSTVSLGVNWASSGYEWAKQKGIVPSTAFSYLSETISSDDFYGALFKFLDLKSITDVDNKYFWKMEDYSSDNYILVSMDRQLTELAKKEWITTNEYKRSETLIKNAHNILNKNEKYFTQKEIANIKKYLDNMSYILYQKIYDYSFKERISVSKPKYGDKFIQYKLIPYYGEISRLEFLNLMYYFMYNDFKEGFSSSKSVSFFKSKEILLGYNNNLMLNVKLTYAHMSTFMQRMY